MVIPECELGRTPHLVLLNNPSRRECSSIILLGFIAVKSRGKSAVSLELSCAVGVAQGMHYHCNIIGI